MPQMSDDLTSILTNAGGVFPVPYLTARGIATVALLARAAASEDALVAGLAAPFISGWQAADGTTQANASDALLVQAALTVAREDARVARALALAPVASAPAPAASPQQAAERPERVPTNSLPGQWSALVDAYNSRYAPAIRAFPEEMLMHGRGGHHCPHGVRTQRRATSPRSSWGRSSANAHSARMARPTASRCTQADSSTGVRIAMDGTFTQVTPQRAPTSAMQILGTLEAIWWAYILCASGEEASALSLEVFCKSRVRRASGDYGFQEVKYLWCSWRLALAMRKGLSFDEATSAMINDLPWQSEQAAVFRQEYPEPASRTHNRSRSRRRRFRERGRKHRSPLGSVAARGPVRTRARTRRRRRHVWTHPCGSPRRTAARFAGTGT